MGMKLEDFILSDNPWIKNYGMKPHIESKTGLTQRQRE